MTVVSKSAIFKSAKITNKRWSIRTYLILMNLVFMVLLFPSVSILYWNKSTEQHQTQLTQNIDSLRASLTDRGASLSRSMALNAELALAGFDFTFLTNVIKQVVLNDKDISYCQIIDTHGIVIIHSDPAIIGSKPDNQLDKTALGRVNAHIKHRPDTSLQIPVDFINVKNNHLMEAITPLYLGEDLWGGLRCGINFQSLNEQINRVESNWKEQEKKFRFYFLSIGLIFFSIGIGIALYFTQVFSVALSSLSEGVALVSRGNLMHRIENKNLLCSEFEQLSHSFNEMTHNLLESRNKLDEYSNSLEQKVADRTLALKAAQAELVKHAREAGMAEIAQGVMHNIGNALTPLKTSAQMASRLIRESKLRSHLNEALKPVSAIIDRSDDPDKYRLSQIVQLIPSGIENEYNLAEQQLVRINERITHIEGIIHLQSKYTRVSDFKEELNFNHVVQDALNMLYDSTTKYHIHIDVDWGDLAPIHGEKHQLLQVLLNLIKNANEAMQSVEIKSRVLSIQTRQVDTENGPVLVATVKDTGCGFTPETKSQLFNFGYSTKAKGTGVGLHASANYLISQKGSLEASSDGEGLGAIFKLTLPY